MTLTMYYVECTETKFRYYNTTKSTNPNFNPIDWFVKMNEEKGHYEKLTQSIKKYGKFQHLIKLCPRDIPDSEKQLMIFRINQKRMAAGTSLNDINPRFEKVTCEKCQQKVRIDYVGEHLKLYCRIANDDDIQELLEL